MKTHLLIRFNIALLLIVSTSLFAQKGDWDVLNLPNSPSARQGSSLVTLPDGRVVLFGGEGPQEDWYNDLYIFEDEQWTEIQPTNSPPPARSFHNAWMSGYEMNVFGGKSSGSVLNDLWVYDVNSNSWQEVQTSGNLPPGRYASSVNILPDGSVVLFGGKDANDIRLKDSWNYNNNAYVQLNSCMLDYAYHFGQLVGDIGNLDILFFGLMNLMCSYSIDNDSWELNGSNIEYYGHGSTITGLNYLDEKIVFIFGGLDGSQQPSDIVYEYNTVSGELIQRQDPLPGTIINGAAAKYFYDKDGIGGFNNEAYEVLMFGGEVDGELSNATWISTSNLLGTETHLDEMDDSVVISPNPSTGLVNITSSGIIKTVNIYNISGELLNEYIVGTNEFKVVCDHLNSGTYIFKIETVNGSYQQKFLIN